MSQTVFSSASRIDFVASPKMNKQADYPVGNQIGFRLPPELAREFRERVGEDKISPIMVELVKSWLHGDLGPRASLVGNEDLVGAPLLDVRVACGPAEEAREEATPFVVSTPVADEFRLDPDLDFWVRARGQSMEGRGIFDEFLVLLRPLQTGRMPRKGEIALIQIVDEEGFYSGTLKTWNGSDEVLPRLLDGDGQEWSFPQNTRSAHPVALAKGVIGAF